MKTPARTAALITLALAGMAFFSGCSLLPGSAPAKPTTAEQTANPDTSTQDVFSVEVGDCLNDTGETQVSDVPLVDCAGAHDYEVYGEYTVPDADYDPTKIGDEADTQCTAMFATFVGIDYNDSTLDYTDFVPTSGSWASGDRIISCMVTDPAGKTTGTLKGAAK